MPFVTTAEVWVPEREQVVFRFIVPAKGDRWTFCVSRLVLEELVGSEVNDPVTGFQQFRPQIYLAAQRRMKWADPKRQQGLDADEIMNAGAP